MITGKGKLQPDPVHAPTPPERAQIITRQRSTDLPGDTPIKEWLTFSHFIPGQKWFQFPIRGHFSKEYCSFFSYIAISFTIGMVTMFSSKVGNNQVCIHGSSTISANDQNTNNKKSALANKIDVVNNSQESLKAKNTGSHEVKKTVSFDEKPTIFIFSDSDERKNDFKLSLMEREYRREVDKEAKKNGLPFAAGHEGFDFFNPESAPYPYNHELAMSEYNEMG